MDLFVSTTFLSDGKPLHEALSQCKNTGILSVEIGSNHCYEESYDYLTDFSFQYLVHNYFPIPKESFVLNIASIEPNIREKSILHIKTAIDFSSEIGGELYTFHPGFMTDPQGSNISDNNYDFQWDEKQLQHINYDKAKSNMYRALDEVAEYALLKKVKIAIETEGSVLEKNHLLMQQLGEYKEFMEKYSSEDIGISLNIGHLNLAANAFNFKRADFVNLVQDYILAMELSHNNGVEDQHLPLNPDGWYWNLILDPRFENSYKILEFRNTKISEIEKNIQMIKEKSLALSVPR